MRRLAKCGGHKKALASVLKSSYKNLKLNNTFSKEE